MYQAIIFYCTTQKVARDVSYIGAQKSLLLVMHAYEDHALHIVYALECLFDELHVKQYDEVLDTLLLSIRKMFND